MSDIMSRVLSSPMLYPIAFAVLSALVTLAGPRLVARVPALGPVLAVLRRIGVDASPSQSGRDAYEHYRAAAGMVSSSGTALPTWEELPDRQRSAWDASVVAMRALVPPSVPPSPPSTPPPGANGSVPPLMLLAFIVLVPTLHGCGASQLEVTADVTNGVAAAGTAAAPIITEVCVEPMREALAAHDVAMGRAIADRCDAPIAAYDLVRRLHVALRADVVAIASGRVPTDTAALVAEAVDAAAKLGSSIAKLGGAR